MLVLPIKKKWYDMILSGEKKEEYRSYSPYWIKRFYNAGMMEFIHAAAGDYYKAKRCTHRLVKFRNGYSANSRSFVAEVSLGVGLGNQQWGAKEGERYLVLKIVKIMDEESDRREREKSGQARTDVHPDEATQQQGRYNSEAGIRTAGDGALARHVHIRLQRPGVAGRL